MQVQQVYVHYTIRHIILKLHVKLIYLNMKLQYIISFYRRRSLTRIANRDACIHFHQYFSTNAGACLYLSRHSSPPVQVPVFTNAGRKYVHNAILCITLYILKFQDKPALTFFQNLQTYILAYHKNYRVEIKLFKFNSHPTISQGRAVL